MDENYYDHNQTMDGDFLPGHSNSFADMESLQNGFKELGLENDIVSRIMNEHPTDAQEIYAKLSISDDPFATAKELFTPSFLGDNPNDQHSVDHEKMGSCDCRSECKYNTGDTAKSSNYGYSG